MTSLQKINKILQALCRRSVRNIMTAYTGNDIERSGTGFSKITLTGCNQNGSGFALSGGAIRIGAGITKVILSAQMVVSCLSEIPAKAKTLSIRKNGTEIVTSLNTSWSNVPANYTTNIAERLIDVQEGDLIELWWYATTKDKLNGNPARTYITIESVCVWGGGTVTG